MAQSLSKILLHLVFSTKQREPWIVPEIRPALHAYLAGAVRSFNAEAYRVGGVADHVHLACTLPRTMPVSKLLGKSRNRRPHGLNNRLPHAMTSPGKRVMVHFLLANHNLTH